MSRPFVYIAGAGPGAPQFMTVRVRKLLSLCDTVLYDHLVDPSVLQFCRPGCELIFVGKEAGKHSLEQAEINSLLVRKAGENKTVLRLKGGDPFVFGRGAEECLALREAGIPYELVPGITSSIAVPMAAGIPVTCRGVSSSFTVLTGHAAGGTAADGTTAGGLEKSNINFTALAALDGTIVFLMGLSSVAAICSGLMDAGMSPSTPGAVISRGTTAEQHTVRGTLETLSEACQNDAGITAPAVIVIGRAAAMDLRTHGVTIAVCGSADFCGRVSEKAGGLGAEVLAMPLVRLVPREDEAVCGAMKRLPSYTNLVFTGRNAVRFFMEAMDQDGLDIRTLAGLRIAVIGPGTAETLKSYHLCTDSMPEEYNSEQLAELLLRETDEHSRILIPRAEKGSPVLAERLAAAGRSFDEIPFYETVFQQSAFFNLSDLPEAPDYAVFGSAEGVRLYFSNGGHLPENCCPVCIGNATGDVLNALAGGKKSVIARRSTVDGIVEQIANQIAEQHILRSEKE